MYDLLIKNGTVVDGTGAPGYRADIAVKDGKILEIGEISSAATKTIDANGLVVAPGFIDHHTHYDAQICWDKMITPSSWHGVTSVIMGHCGVGLAPCRPEAREVVTWDLVNIEGLSYEVLKKGVTWDWESFPDYMDAAAKRGSAINLGFIAPLTPFRHYVMGEASKEREANAEETAQIRDLIADAVEKGAFGFSTTIIGTHIGHGGLPLACRRASRDEFGAYCHVLQKAGRGVIEIALTDSISVLDDKAYDLLDFLLTESTRPVTWIPLLARDDLPNAWRDSLAKSAPLIAKGAVAQMSARPLITDINLRSPTIMGQMDCWTPVFSATVERQKEIYSSSEFRSAFRHEMKSPRVFNGRWDRLVVLEAQTAGVKPYEGRSIADIALERGADGLDTFLDIAIEDDLAVVFTIELFNSDQAQVAAMLKDERTIIGLSDGGAHVDMLCDAGYATYVLGHWVREAGALSLEEAVRGLTSKVADLWGIKTRGRIAPGLVADLVLFDPETVGSATRATARYDFPGDTKRLVVDAFGIHHTIVNGTLVYENGLATGALPGAVLRSGLC